MKQKDTKFHSEPVTGYVYLRVIACLAIVILHTAYGAGSEFEEVITSFQHTVTMTVTNCMMWAVPCFVMITGALLLPPEKDISYEKWVLKNENIKLLCQEIKLTKNKIDNIFEEHDFECEFKLLNWITNDSEHRNNLVDNSPEIKTKNRYQEIRPFNFNKVELKNNKYLNASYIDGPFENIDNKLFIAINYIASLVVNREFKDDDGEIIKNKVGYFKNAIEANFEKLNKIQNKNNNELENTEKDDDIWTDIYEDIKNYMDERM